MNGRYTYWDTDKPRSDASRCVKGLTYPELQKETGCPNWLRERLDADTWPPAYEWAGYVIVREDRLR